MRRAAIPLTESMHPSVPVMFGGQHWPALSVSRQVVREVYGLVSKKRSHGLCLNV